MKNLFCLCCLVSLAVACQRDISPNEQLYQRWQLVQTRQGSGAWVVSATTTLYDTEYRPDGTIVYRLDGKVTNSCCKPTQYSRQANEIAFGDITICELAICAGPLSPNAQAITQLTDDLLELTNGQTVSQYKSVK